MAEIRCWLVKRDYFDKNLVTLVYSTTDGTRKLTSQRSSTMLRQKPVTAAVSVAESELTPVEADEQDAYATEAQRMAERHDPDDTV
jgi:hypothetical protein